MWVEQFTLNADRPSDRSGHTQASVLVLKTVVFPRVVRVPHAASGSNI
jgi:hypothetical protein